MTKNRKEILSKDPLPGMGSDSAGIGAPKKAKMPVVGEEEKQGRFKRSGHLTDQMLKYNYPKDKIGAQLSFLDSLSDGTIHDIEAAGVEKTEVVEGIKLSPSETKVIDCLCKLLHDRSQTFEPTSSDYYTGNLGHELTEYGGEKNVPAPRISFTLYELTKEYIGGEAPSGKEIGNVTSILQGLDNKRFLIRYTETVKYKNDKWVKKEIEAFRKLLFLDKATLSYGEGDLEYYKKADIIVTLNPIFRRQIDSKFILYPNDINKRTILAYGSPNISDITLRLRDYLARQASGGEKTHRIYQEKLYYLVAEKWMKENRKKKVKEYLDKAIETVKALGLLLSYEVKPGKTGEPQVIFKLNTEWQ